jgi:hypothetical protein
MFVRTFSLVVITAFSVPVVAAPPAAEAPSAEQLARIIRGMILPVLPAPLVEQKYNWGNQRDVIVGVKWEKEGILLRPHLLKKMHNDGIWRQIQVEADHPETNLKVQIQDIRVPEKGKLTFSTCLSLQTNIKFEQQFWRAGTRLYSGETRARARVVLKLNCESTSRFEKKPDSLIPDYVFRLRVTAASLSYDNFVCEHTVGVGGDVAKILGEAILETVNQLKPSLERKLLEKANAKIVKVADTKEVRLSLTQMLEGSAEKK